MRDDMSADRDRLAYIRAVVLHRCPEIGPADIAMLAIQPDDTLPLAAADQIVEVIGLMETRLESLIARQSLPPPETVVEAFRQAMIDMTLPEKVAVVDQLTGWIELERSTYESLN